MTIKHARFYEPIKSISNGTVSIGYIGWGGLVISQGETLGCISIKPTKLSNVTHLYHSRISKSNQQVTHMELRRPILSLDIHEVNGLYYKFTLIFSKTTMEDVNYLNLAILFTWVDLKKPSKFGSESVLYTIVTIAFHYSLARRAGHGLQQ